MATIKAKAEITIFNVKDVKSVTRYYLLQSSTATAPAKPTTINPGGNWKTTEPSYTDGSTNTLYFVDLTIMSDGKTFSYSDVSKSSSYEAAKSAWNKANNAQKTADGIANNIYVPGTVQINGGKIQAGSLDVSKILMGDPSNLSQLSEHTYASLGWSAKSNEKEDYQVTFIRDLQVPVGDRPEYNLKVPVSFAYSGNPQGMKYLLTMDDYDIVGYTASTGKTESLKNQSYFSLSPKILYTKPATMQPYVKFENIASNTWVLSMPESMPMVKDFQFYMCIAKADGVPSGLTYITLSISNLRITKITDGSSITGIIKSTNYVEDSNGDCISGMMTNYSSGEIRTPNGRWDDDGLVTKALSATGGKIGGWDIRDGTLYSAGSASSDDGTQLIRTYTILDPTSFTPIEIIVSERADYSDADWWRIESTKKLVSSTFDYDIGKLKAGDSFIGGWGITASRIISKIGLSMGAGGAGLILCNEDGKPVIWIQDKNSKQTFRVDQDGTMYHNDNVLGEVITKNVGAKSMSSGTWTDTGASVTLPAGKYVVNGTVLFNSAANGQRGARFATSSTDYFRESQQMNIAGTTKGVTSVQCSYIADLKTSTKLNLQGIQSSGAALSTINSYIQAIRIA
ncbi:MULTISPECIES: hypothetical protein [unclassified Coprococcus]|uniref:hypothetical protein n=1 Tax=unclassified Coprococcus TaxID=2684943 RepID=UPI000E4A3EF7|nr:MULTISPECIES: hypothetical protein [unclassified Coprococcus]RGI33556.1 hypothetical protein DXB91_12465 [Coprococcus sp. OM06-34AC]RGI40944.1 hypothetical protein DXB88_10695 [Coprococcus sp. OM06-25]